MTRKDYVTTAQILGEYVNAIDQFVFEDLVTDFCDMFFTDNPNFSPAKFTTACYKNADE